MRGGGREASVLHVITGLDDGGAEAVLYRLCSTDREHRHHVVSMMDAGKYGPLLEATGITVTCLGMSRGRLSAPGLLRLLRVLREWQPAVIQTWMYHADLVGGCIARLAGIEQVFWAIHNSTLEPGRSRCTTRAIARVNARLSHRVPAAIACCAERSRDVHATLGYAAEKLVVIPNGYDVARFRPDVESRAALRRAWSVPADVPLIGMVGRYDPQKDHDNLLRALARLRDRWGDFRCVLVGRGLDADNSVLRARVNQLELADRILLAGQRADVPAVMNALDLHVLSSAFGEAFPNVLAEAMACGTPCVTTDVGDAGFIVGDTGWRSPPGDSEALADALAAALASRRDGAAWQRRSEAARARVVAHFGLDRMVAAYGALWRGELAGKRATGLEK